MAHTHTHTEPQTDGHGDSMTESAKWGHFFFFYILESKEKKSIQTCINAIIQFKRGFI